MSTKTEEKLKTVLKEFLEQKEKNIDTIIMDRTIGILFWGIIIGSLFTYLALFPFFIGFIIGVITVKKNPFMINYILDKSIGYILNGRSSIMNKLSAVGHPPVDQSKVDYNKLN
jgi:hypothetical protein